MEKPIWNVIRIFLSIFCLTLVGCNGSLIIITSPSDGATNSSIHTSITITFTQSVDPNSFEGRITPEVEFDTSFSSGNTVIILTPKSILSKNTTYTVTIETLIFADGSNLTEPFSFSFTTSGETISISDKWKLWSTDKALLRGADLHPCRIFSEANGCIETISQQDIQDLRNRGANLINASYPGLYEQLPPFRVSSTNQEYLDNLMNWAEKVGIYVVIHMRTGPGRNEAAITNPEGDVLMTVWTDQATHDAWVAMWRYMANRYRNNQVVIGYDLMVEPHVNTWMDPEGTLSPEEFAQEYQGTLADWNAFASEITAAIREVDTETPIIINSLMWGNASWFPALSPTGDPRTIYSLHTYDPDIYTNQEGLGPVIHYPSKMFDGGEFIDFDRTWLENHYRPVREFAQQHNVPIYVGEYGLFRWVPDATVFINDQVDFFEGYGWSYAYYVWRGDEENFNGFNPELGTDRRNNTPIPGNPLLTAFTAHWKENVNFPDIE